ncbi:hypothetical protein RhiirA5_425938 [Rhizophagus irregularis]|uniref:Uncharacterized protein n=1 Tax=Rhizophagus irregularis TaxID=588596 RepID=A0A2N0P528_9GLOM|nr:hypothetical protein RhiirA5_425938 [Rhizophagus irregularis]CAB4476304.1 unnamed protein product [Rhizophagus irregularis]
MDSKKQSNSSTNITVLKLKRRKVVKTNLSIPTRSQEIGQVYIIGSNEFSQCGMEDLKCSKRLNPKNSDGKIVTWGINDHSILGCFTESPKSVEAKLIFERGNYNIVEEVKPVYAEGLDNVSIVKVVCGDNATFAISDQGHLYAIRQEWSY